MNVFERAYALYMISNNQNTLKLTRKIATQICYPLSVIVNFSIIHGW